jgi:hypothetical protein
LGLEPEKLDEVACELDVFLHRPGKRDMRDELIFQHEVFRWREEWVGVEGPEDKQLWGQIRANGVVRGQSGQLVL